MTYETFDLAQQAVIVSAIVEVDGMTRDLKLLVDTGTYETLICETAIKSLWLTPANCIEQTPIRTVTGSDTAYRYQIDSITALGIEKRNIKIISYPMPRNAGVDGLLGLDFFVNRKLIIDFILSQISVVSGRNNGYIND